MFLLDTNVVSELRKPRPHPAVVTWIERQADDALHIAALTLGELQAGVEQLRPRDPQRADAIEAWIDDVAASYAVLPADGGIWRAWARLMSGRAESLYEDALIAATAIAHGLTVVTRNGRDFKALGVPTLDPFEAPR